VSRSTHALSAKRVVGVLGGLGLGALSGFAASLLRSRPPTIYAGGLHAADDTASPEPDGPGLPESASAQDPGSAEERTA
jgi:hypothetical protein